jgi:hypothetical protein
MIISCTRSGYGNWNLEHERIGKQHLLPNPNSLLNLAINSVLGRDVKFANIEVSARKIEGAHTHLKIDELSSDNSFWHFDVANTTFKIPASNAGLQNKYMSFCACTMFPLFKSKRMRKNLYIKVIS